MISQQKSVDTSVYDGEKHVYNYFCNHNDTLKLSDTTIYNRMVLETGYKPVNSEVAIYILKFIGEMREIFSDKTVLEIFNYYRQEMLAPQKETVKSIHITGEWNERENQTNS